MKLAKVFEPYESLFSFLPEMYQFEHVSSINQGYFWSETVLANDAIVVCIMVEHGHYWVGCRSVSEPDPDQWLGILEIRVILTGETIPKEMVNNLGDCNYFCVSGHDVY